MQERARGAYALFVQDNTHPSLQFKRVHPTRPIYSVRVTQDYRALGVVEGDSIVWFWIGDHEDFDRDFPH